jgi:mannose-6-phosphate isomerase-like protein (cupin superfamily)
MAGDVFVRQDGDLLELGPGDCLLTPPGVAHHIVIHNPDAECLVLSFTCTDSYLSALRGQVIATDRWQQRVQDIQRELRSAFRLEKEALL